MNKTYRYLLKSILLIWCVIYGQMVLAWGDPFTMPDIIGLDKDIAKQKIIEACGDPGGKYSCRTTMITPYKNTEAANDHVFRVQPAPGETVTRDAIIRIDYSMNSMTSEKFNSLTQIPNVIGMTVDEATKVLNAAGWESFTPGGFNTHKIAIEYVDTDPTNTYKNGQILKTAHDSRGWGVVLTVLNKESVAMPNLIGKSYSEAEKILKDTGLFKEIKREEIIYTEEFLKENPSRKNELHTVVRVSPNAGTLIDPDTDNYVWIAEGIPEAEKTVQVPNIGQLKESTAIAALKQDGLIPQITYEKTSSAFLGGTASVKTDPKQGSNVKAGTVVKITIYVYNPLVPSVKYYTKDEAIKMITDAGLKYEISYQSISSSTKDGKVAEQDPAARTMTEPGSIVKLVVYKYDQITIPNLVLMKEEKAIDYLKKYKSELNYDVIYQNTVYTSQAGYVSKISPEYKAIAKPGDTLRLYVYKMIESVPDVTGKTEADAISILEKNGFTVRKTYSDSKQVGKVIQQSQKAGESVKGAVITITIGKKPDDINLPNVIGKYQQDAINTINSTKNLTSKIQYLNVYESSKDGLVTNTYPAPNTMVLPDSQITIYVGKYVGTIPNVVGLSENEAKSKLSQAGFAGIVFYTTQGTPGKVLNQKPDAGSAPSGGSNANFVNIYVTRTQAVTNNQPHPWEQEYVMPYVTGLSLMEARAMLAANKINFVIRETQTGKDRHGKLLSSQPGAGNKVFPNQTAILFVGRDYYAVPNLIGLTGNAATSYIKQCMMQPKVIMKKPSPYVKKSAIPVVVEQTPKPGVPKQGSYITITLAYDLEAPGLIGKSFAEAIYTLQNSSLKYEIEYEQVEDGSKSGKVLAMSPNAGQPIPVGSTIRLKIGKLPDVVPDVIGKSESEAVSILQKLNFYPEKEYISSNKSNNIVIAQSQNPGAKRGPCNIKIILGTQEAMSSIATPTPIIHVAPAIRAQQSMRAEVAQGAPPPQAQVLAISADETNKIKELYTNLKQAYEYKDEYQLIFLLSDNWESSDGSTVQDVEDNLRNKFTIFDSIQCNISNLNISKNVNNLYRATYDIEITGKMYESGILRKEKSSVSEEIIVKNGKYLINKTLSGNFWYRE